MPTMVLIRIGNTAAKIVMMIFEIEPRPNIMMISGSKRDQRRGVDAGQEGIEGLVHRACTNPWARR